MSDAPEQSTLTYTAVPDVAAYKRITRRSQRLRAEKWMRYYVTWAWNYFLVGLFAVVAGAGMARTDANVTGMLGGGLFGLLIGIVFAVWTAKATSIKASGRCTPPAGSVRSARMPTSIEKGAVTRYRFLGRL